MKISRRSFISYATAFTAAPALWGEEAPKVVDQPGFLARFLGCGASRWNKEWGKNPHMRRQSSLMLDNAAVFDFTMCSFDKLPANLKPESLFITHSHGDHFNPLATVKLGVKNVFVHSSWLNHAKKVIHEASVVEKLPCPEITGLQFGKPVESAGMKVTQVPSMHSTSRLTDGELEQTSMYLVEKGASRLLYATDTGGISCDAARMIGIDIHVNEKKFKAVEALRNNPYVHEPMPLTAFIMEATNGDDDENFRMFVHSSVQNVDRIVKCLKKTNRFVPPAGQKAILTHLGIKYRSWPSKRIEKEISPELAAAYDGWEVRIG
jgi:phosphoribosyl 1,2-cyclic phosphodiesterase